MQPGGKQPHEVRLSGVVNFTSDGGRSVEVRIGKTGVFSVALPPGTYRVAGRSPEISELGSSGGGREPSCSQPLSVTVASGHTSDISVTCVVP
jgi:hypothetical protein